MTKGPIVRYHNQTDQVSADEPSTLLKSVIEEGIRQSKQSADQSHLSFFIAMLLTTFGTVLGFGGAAMLLTGNASEGSVTTAAGLASGVYSYQLSKDAAERQKQANERLDQMLRQLQLPES